MNILVTAPFGMYRDYTASFIHNQAKAYVRLGHRVRVVLPLAVGKRLNGGKRFGPLVERLQQDGVELFYIRHISLSRYGERHFNAASLLTVLRMVSSDVLRDFPPDVIHVHTIGYGGKVGKFFRELCHVPCVITTHGGDTDLALEAGYLQESKVLCGSADAVAAVSSQLEEKVKRLGCSTPTCCILNGFSAEHIVPACPVPHRIIQVGNLVVSKHVELTIRAVAALRERYPDITLSVVGSGSERAGWEAVAQAGGIADAVTFLGRLSNPRTLQEMAHAEIFCMPSYPEGFGIVYLEAMASGCVTIGTQGEGIADLITSGENGFLVPRDDVSAIVDVIDRCFRNEDLMRRIAERGKADAMRLTWEHNAAQYLELFTSLETKKLS